MQLSEFLRNINDIPYRKFVEHHIRKQSARQLRDATLGETIMLPDDLQPQVLSFIDALNHQILKQSDFWENASCGVAAEAILGLATTHFNLGWEKSAAAAIPEESQETAFRIFQIATLSFAYTAIDQPQARKFMKIRKGWLKL